MIAVKKQLISFETAKKLKTTGCPQESLFYWVNFGNGSGEFKIYYIEDILKDIFRYLETAEYPEKNYEQYELNLVLNYFKKMELEYYSAFSAEEIGNILPETISEGYLDITKENNKWNVDYINDKDEGFFEFYNLSNDNLAEAIADIILQLIEKKFISFIGANQKKSVS